MTSHEASSNERKISKEESSDFGLVEEGVVVENKSPRDKPKSPPRRNKAKKLKCPPLFDTKPKKYAWCILALIVVITAIALIVTSLQRLDSTQYGIKYNVHTKQLADAAAAGGLHSGPPGFEFIQFPKVQNSVEDFGKCNSLDGLQVDYQVTYQYQIPKEWLLPAILKYRDYYGWATVVEAAASSAIQHSCAEFDILSFQTQRGVIQAEMEANLQIKLEGEVRDGESGVYARAISLQLRNLQIPSRYDEAIAEKQEAAEDIQLAKRQREQELTKAQTKFLSSEQKALETLDKARIEANLTISEAMLSAQETTFIFEQESAALTRVRRDLGLTSDGLLAYLSTQLYGSASEVTVSTGEPARMSRKEEL